MFEREGGRRKGRKILTSDTSKPIPTYILPFLAKFHDEIHVHRIGL
jgi:hypothetical protein